MLRPLIETGKDGSRLLQDNRRFVILSRELADGVQRIKLHDRDEFNFFSGFAAEQLNIYKTANAPVQNAGENFLLEQRFIYIRIAGGCPSVPDSTDHRTFVSFLRGIQRHVA
jgi:hypothetical protein